MSDRVIPTPPMCRPRWGDPERTTSLPDAAAALLTQLGARPAASAVPAADVTLPEAGLPAEARAELRAAVGEGHVRDDREARIAHTRGYSTPDLLRLRAGDGSAAPDAVVLPGSHDEVLAVLDVCTRRRIAVTPFSGGTSVVGGLAAARDGFDGVIALDLGRLDGLVALDEESRVATLQAGLRGPRAEELLNARGFTLGHFPQSYEGASIGGYAAARSAGQASAGYGRFDEMVVGLELATPRGTISLGTAERSAAGPDLRQLVLGSEGVLGVITSVSVKVRPAPSETAYEGWRFPSFDSGVEALRALAQDGPLPTVLRLSDEVETAVNAVDEGGSSGGCQATVGYEGTPEDVSARRAGASAVLRAHGGEPVGVQAGEAWRRGRFEAPYLRDALLDAGGLAETLESATFWSNLGALKAAVTDALVEALSAQGTPPLVLCHVSHVYAAGASLYFTVLCAMSDEPLSQWAAAKAAANGAIGSAGATITHHHGVGADHRDAYALEIGPLAVEVLRAAKQTLDPAGILNPGVLI